VEDIYNEFNFGISDPRAIRRFVGVAMRVWRQAPRYVLLAGSGTYDYKDHLGMGDNLLPPMMVVTANGIQVSDARFADITRDGLPDVAVGRIPATTTEALSAAISRIISYEAGGEWKNNVLMSADNLDKGGDFARSSELVLGSVDSSYSVTRAYLDSNSVAEVRAMIHDNLSSGAGIFNYIGHAGLTGMAEENVFTVGDIDGLENADHAAVVLSSSCDLAQFGIPGYTSLGEALVTESNGASAVWSATGPAYNRNSVELADGVFESIFSDNTARLGDAIADSFIKNKYGSSLSDSYVLLGDPALAVGSSQAPPRVSVVPDTISFDEWQHLIFAPVNMWHAEADQDADGDGVSNRMAYLLGTDAQGGGAGRGFAIKTSKMSGSKKLAELSFWKRRGEDINVRVSGCENLGVDSWKEVPVESMRQGSSNGTMEEVVLSVRIPDGMNKKVFFRVTVGE